MENEPVRLSGYAALVVGLVLVAVIGWASGLDLRAIVLQVASLVLTSTGGLEFARRHAWSPTSTSAATAYALSLDPETHDAEREAVLDKLGIPSTEEARRIIGAD